MLKYLNLYQKNNLPLMCCLFFVALMCVINVAAAAPQEKRLYVQLKQSTLRSQPKFWGSVLAELTYGTELTPISTSSEDKSWLKVKYGEVEGYAHVTAVTSRKINLGASSKTVKNNVDPLSTALAGKGFNRQVEGAYASSKGVDYSVVDFIETQKINNEEFYAFLREGKLNEE